MTLNGWLQILIFFLIILAITKPMGVFMAHVFNREKTFLDPVLRPIERLIYRLTRVDEKREMRWTEYAASMLLFSSVSMLLLYLTQMVGLAYHNFVSAAVGIALAVAFIRGIARREMQTIGNFWVDMVRASLWVLLPFCIVAALFLVSQGVVQNLRPYDSAKLVEPLTIEVDKKDASGNVITNPDGTTQ